MNSTFPRPVGILANRGSRLFPIPRPVGLCSVCGLATRGVRCRIATKLNRMTRARVRPGPTMERGPRGWSSWRSQGPSQRGSLRPRQDRTRPGLATRLKEADRKLLGASPAAPFPIVPKGETNKGTKWPAPQ